MDNCHICGTELIDECFVNIPLIDKKLYLSDLNICYCPNCLLVESNTTQLELSRNKSL